MAGFKSISKSLQMPHSDNPTSPGSAGFDNPRENVDPHIKTQVVNTRQGTVDKAATTDKEIANKKYVDDAIAAAGGHARQHAITTAADHTSGATSGRILKADANGLPVDATNTDAEVSGAVTHAADNTQAHSDYLLNSGVDEGVGLTLTGDNSSADTAYVPMVLYNTDATPPAANTVPVGTIYIQYTA